MTKLNLKAGDIGETDQINEAEIEKLAKQDARREAQRKGRLAEVAGKNSSKNERQMKLVTPQAPKNEKAPKPKKEPKAPAQTKGPQYLHRDSNPHGFALLSPEIVDRAFAAKAEGLKSAAIAEKLNISQSSVGTILSGPTWFRERMERYGGTGWTYPAKVEVTSEKKQAQKGK